MKIDILAIQLGLLLINRTVLILAAIFNLDLVLLKCTFLDNLVLFLFSQV